MLCCAMLCYAVLSVWSTAVMPCLFVSLLMHSFMRALLIACCLSALLCPTRPCPGPVLLLFYDHKPNEHLAPPFPALASAPTLHAPCRRVGMQPPSVTVRYRGLSVLSRMAVADRSIPTLKKTVKRQAEVSHQCDGRCRAPRGAVLHCRIAVRCCTLPSYAALCSAVLTNQHHMPAQHGASERLNPGQPCTQPEPPLHAPPAASAACYWPRPSPHPLPHH